MNGSGDSFYVTGGTLRHDAPCYIERQADRQLLEGLLQGEFCYVLTSRQMGKSSLMVRTASKLREQGINVAVLDLTAIGQNLTAEQWYDGLVVRVGRQLHLEAELEKFWQDHLRLSPIQRFFAALRDVAMGSRAGRMVIFVDEIDTVRSLPFSADEFFAAMRECYNRRAEDPELSRLAFCLLGVAMPSDLIQDTRLTPFNIGRRIELHDFTESEATPLALGLKADASSSSSLNAQLLQRILYWTNGHPYLTQRLCQAVAERNANPATALRHPQSVDQLCDELFFSLRAREQDDNLLFVRDRLLRSGQDVAALLILYGCVLRSAPLRLTPLERWLWSVYARIRRRERVTDNPADPLVSVLRLAGITRVEEGCLQVRNRIYTSVFDHNWVSRHLPDAEVRRQRAAFWLGVLRTTGIGVVVVAVLVSSLLYARHKALQAETANVRLSRVTVEALRAQSRAGRLAGRAGQRMAGLKAMQEAVQIDPASVALRNEAIACLALPDLQWGRSWPGFPDGTTALAFDARLERYARSDAQGTVSLRGIEDDQEMARLPGPGSGASQLRFSPGNAHLAVVYPNEGRQLFWIWDVQKRAPVVQLTNALHEHAFDFSDDGKLVAVGGSQGTLQIFDLVSNSSRSLEMASAPLLFRFRPGSHELAISRVASLGLDLVNVDSGRWEEPYHVADTVRAFTWSRDGKLLAVACPDKRIRVRNMVTLRLAELEGHQDVPTRMAFSHSGKWLATAGPDNTVRLWDPRRSGKPLVTFEGPIDVRQLQFSPDDRRLAGNVSGEVVQLWNVESGNEYESLFDAEALKVASLDVHPGGRLAACAFEAGVALWDLESGSKFFTLAQGMAHAVVFNPVTGDMIVSDITGTWTAPIKFGSPDVGALVQVEVGPRRTLNLPARVSRIQFAGDGLALATVWDDRVQVLRADDLSVLADLPGDAGLTHVVLAPKSQWVAVAHWRKGEVWVWDLTAGNRRIVLPTPGRAHVACSPDGTRLAIGTETTCALWSAGAWQPGKLLIQKKPASRPTLMAFSPDGSVLAFTSGDADIHLVEIKTGISLAQLESPRKEPLISLQFTPEGSRLLSATEASSIAVWDLATLRQGLAKVGLDWALPSYAAISKTAGKPLTAVMAPDDTNREAIVRRRLERLTEKLKQTPKDPRLWETRAYLYDVELKEFEKAAADWEECLKLEPTNTWALRDLAFLHLYDRPSLRNYALARELASKAVALEPANVDNQYRAGMACYRCGDCTNALVYLHDAARLIEQKKHGLTPFILLHQAMCHATLGRPKEAQACYDQALKVVEGDPEFYRKYRARFDYFKGEAEKVLGK